MNEHCGRIRGLLFQTRGKDGKPLKSRVFMGVCDVEIDLVTEVATAFEPMADSAGFCPSETKLGSMTVVSISFGKPDSGPVSGWIELVGTAGRKGVAAGWMMVDDAPFGGLGVRSFVDRVLIPSDGLRCSRAAEV